MVKECTTMNLEGHAMFFLTAAFSKCHSVSEEPPADGTKRRVTDVLDEDVLCVLDRHRTDLSDKRHENDRTPLKLKWRG